MLKTFLPLFAMTFFIVLFIVLMQFLWKYIDDLVGKGLSIDVLGELFFYAAVSMVPMALPLAILLASLMTFGNLGEKFELTAMKASGISLVRVMAPLIVTVGAIAVGAFFFQNDVLPKAQVKMWTLLFSVRQKSPELEIPEDVFYDQIPGFNLYVKHKDRETGMLRGVMIYDVSNGGDNATILTSDSAQLALTPDMRYLYLHLYKGEQFENLRDQNQRGYSDNTPFRREEFADKKILIPFDANFNRLDEGGMRKQYVGKNIDELRHTMDSVSVRMDSIGRADALPLRQTEVAIVGRGESGRTYSFTSTDTSSWARKAETKTFATQMERAGAMRADTMLARLGDQKRAEVLTNTLNIIDRKKQVLQFRAQTMAEEKKTFRRHEIELIKKFTLSVACLIFFFIGAPLGAIIRKGGLGTPLVISVLLFVVYYIIDNTGYKMARDGKIEVWVGMWLSTFVLAPLGVYVTWKAMNDSAVFDKDRYVGWIRKVLGIKGERSVASKEVIINDIVESDAIAMLASIREQAVDLGNRYGRLMSYKNYWLHGISRERVTALSDSLESTVTYLTDSRDPQVINKLGDYPVIANLWVYRPSTRRWLGWTMMVVFPIGLPVYLAGIQAQRDLRDDCRRICETTDKLMELIAPATPETPGIETSVAEGEHTDKE